jgi:hypothetical protein
MSLTKASYSLITGAPVNVLDYGAVADANVTTGVGTNSTQAIQNAINFASSAARPVYIPGGNYSITNLVVPATTRIFGDGRHLTNLIVRDGTTGRVITDDGNAAKIQLEDFAVYGRNVAGVTTLLYLGYNGVDFGTEGILRNLFLRDTLGDGLNVRGNVGFFETISVWDCDTPITIIGVANMASHLVAYRGVNISAYLGGVTVNGLEIEAPASGSIPLYIFRDSFIYGLYMSIATDVAYTFSHLIELDPLVSNYSLSGVEYVFGATPSNITVTNENIKKTSTGQYFGGNATNGSFTGNGTYLSNVSIGTGEIQSFNFRLVNDAGTIKHRIGASGDSSVAGNYYNKINGASTTLTATPTGTNATTAFAAGAKINSANFSVVYFNTAAQVIAEVLLGANIVINSSTVSLAVSASISSVNINGVTQSRLSLQFTNSTTGANYDLTTLGAGTFIEVGFNGTLA